jgi:hypothetical protein
LGEGDGLSSSQVASEELDGLKFSFAHSRHEPKRQTMIAPIKFTKKRKMTILNSPQKLPNTVVFRVSCGDHVYPARSQAKAAFAGKPE